MDLPTAMWLIPWFLAQLIYSFPPTVWSIRCVQCSSLSNPLCVSGRVRPSACTTLGPEAHYCVRYIGKLDNGRIVYRDCSRKDMGIGCMTKRNTKNVTVRVCVTTCATDGCNRDSAEAPEFPASGQQLIHLDTGWTFLLILIIIMILISS